jgi:hypothetical protein
MIKFEFVLGVFGDFELMILHEQNFKRAQVDKNNDPVMFGIRPQLHD